MHLDFKVLDRSESDHFPFNCRINLEHINNNRNDFGNNKEVSRVNKYKWQERFADVFRVNINTLLNENCNIIMNLITTNIEAAIDKINAVYYEAGKNMLLLPNFKRSLQPLWWDEQCDNLKKQKYTYLRKFRASNLASDLNEYKDRRNIFKNY